MIDNFLKSQLVLNEALANRFTGKEKAPASGARFSQKKIAARGLGPASQISLEMRPDCAGE
jgi:hypothetical protein